MVDGLAMEVDERAVVHVLPDVHVGVARGHFAREGIRGSLAPPGFFLHGIRVCLAAGRSPPCVRALSKEERPSSSIPRRAVKTSARPRRYLGAPVAHRSRTGRDLVLFPPAAKLAGGRRAGRPIRVLEPTMNAPAEHRHADVTARPSPAQKARVLERLGAVLPADCLLHEVEDTRPFECDGLSAFRQLPMAVALPETEDQVREVLQACRELDVPVVARGAGTSLSGGSMPHGAGVVLSLAKFNRILAVDPVARIARVQPGVTNLGITHAVEPEGFYYAPDPSSQIACSIGGNVAENSGGVHCLKYGLTTNNVLGCEIVLITGEVLRIGGKAPECSGYDLMGVITGSEGLLGVVTEVTVRILRKPETARALLIGFPTNEQGGQCVARHHRRRHHSRPAWR